MALDAFSLAKQRAIAARAEVEATRLARDTAQKLFEEAVARSEAAAERLGEASRAGVQAGVRAIRLRKAPIQ